MKIMKKKAIFGTVAATTLPLALFMLSVLNYDSIDFYQSDLDATRAKLNNIEKSFDSEMDISMYRAKEMTKKTAQYAEMEKLYAQHAINPEKNAYLEPKIDSLSNIIDSLKNEFFVNHCSENLDKLHEEYRHGVRRLVMLQNDSIINDSIKNQPIIPRFKKNWNEMFSRQR
jgi:hypothetical protein